jgi:hypothetical protein
MQSPSPYSFAPSQKTQVGAVKSPIPYPLSPIPYLLSPISYLLSLPTSSTTPHATHAFRISQSILPSRWRADWRDAGGVGAGGDKGRSRGDRPLCVWGVCGDGRKRRGRKVEGSRDQEREEEVAVKKQHWILTVLNRIWKGRKGWGGTPVEEGGLGPEISELRRARSWNGEDLVVMYSGNMGVGGHPKCTT